MATKAQATQHKRAASTVFDLELDDVDGSRLPQVDIEQLQELVRVLSRNPAQLQLLKDAEQAREIAVCADTVDLRAFAEVLAGRQYLVCLRTGKPDRCYPGVASLKHTFVVAGVPQDGASDKQPPVDFFVVDPCFRDSFLLSNATAAYNRLCDILPSTYVGTGEQLVPIVEFMCSQMQVVFAESGISFPPWRQSACITSKWLPSNVEDVRVCAPDNSSSSTMKIDSASSDPTGAVEESPFAGPVSAPHLTCQIPRTTSVGSVSACSPLVYTPRAKPPYYSDNSSSNILLSGSLAGAAEGILGVTTLLDASDYELLADSSCIVCAGKTPDSWQVGKSGYLGTATSWRGSGAPLEACYSYRDVGEELDCAGAVVIKSRESSTTSGRDLHRDVSRTTSNLTAALAAAGPLSREVSNISRGSLDISRLDNTASDLDMIHPRALKQQQQCAAGGIGSNRALGSPRTPGKHQKNGLLSSALSAAIAGKGLGRI